MEYFIAALLSAFVYSLILFLVIRNAVAAGILRADVERAKIRTEQKRVRQAETKAEEERKARIFTRLPQE